MKQIDEVLKEITPKKLLAIFPHPDDETMVVGNLLLHAKKLGFETHVFILTQGAAGQIHIHPHGKTLKQVRREELLRAAKILKVDNLIIDDFDDGKLRDQSDVWLIRVKEVIQSIKPAVIVTFDPSGWTGHPDHIVTSIKIKSLIKEKFPKITLLWRAVPDVLKDKWIHKDCADCMVEAQYVVDPKRSWITKWRAAREYKSQRFGQKILVPLIRIVQQHRLEWYHKVDFSKIYKHKFVKFDI